MFIHCGNRQSQVVYGLGRNPRQSVEPQSVTLKDEEYLTSMVSLVHNQPSHQPQSVPTVEIRKPERTLAPVMSMGLRKTKKATRVRPRLMGILTGAFKMKRTSQRLPYWKLVWYKPRRNHLQLGRHSPSDRCCRARKNALVFHLPAPNCYVWESSRSWLVRWSCLRKDQMALRPEARELLPPMTPINLPSTESVTKDPIDRTTTGSVKWFGRNFVACIHH